MDEDLFAAFDADEAESESSSIPVIRPLPTKPLQSTNESEGNADDSEDGSREQKDDTDDTSLQPAPKRAKTVDVNDTSGNADASALGTAAATEGDDPSSVDPAKTDESAIENDSSSPIVTKEPARKYPFKLDPFQQASIDCLEKGESVLVAAHTSAGKTVVAEYAIALCLRDAQRVVYTSPIKALSNQKYRDLCEEFGDVGLMTGDTTINPGASVLVMTTEILRNILYRIVLKILLFKSANIFSLDTMKSKTKKFDTG